MAADVAGYSRLISADEAATLAAMRSHREELWDPLTETHGGRLVGTAGDSLLVEFPSAVAAISCAVAIQRAMADRNHAIPEAERVRLRIGINLGDVVVDGGNIHGDGVNIAARLEAEAQPDGLCISDDVARQIQGRLELGLVDGGERDLKNIARPVRVWHWSPEAVASPPAEAPLALPDKPSIAVLPFENMSSDAEQDYLADGITEDLITALSKIRWFFVIARNSTFTYKGQAVEVTRVGKELGVRYVLEGSVRKAGRRVRITAQLVDATTGRHVWAERYDRQFEDIFDLQDEMTQTIVGAVEPELSAVERERASRKPPENLDAWESFQRGLWYVWKFDPESHHQALKFFRRATELDPEFASAHAYLGFSHYHLVIMGWADEPARNLKKAMAAARTALALDERDPLACFAAGRVFMMWGQHDASIASLRRAIDLNPNFAMAYFGLGMTLTLAGQLEDAKAALGQCIRLSPRDPVIWGSTMLLAMACLLSGELEEALDWGRKTLQIPRAAGYWPHAILAATLAQMGRMDDARGALRNALDAKPDLSISYLIDTLPTTEPDGLEAYLEGLRRAGLPE